MSIQVIKGDLLKSDVDYICHQVNCQGKMNSGIAKSIREKWPKVYYTYIQTHSDFSLSSILKLQDLLGYNEIISIGVQSVVNMYAQFNYGYDGKRYTSYDAFWCCLHDLKQSIPKGSKIGFPYKIGCVRGGANWNIIYEMIKEVLSEDFEVYIYKLEEND